ncbi:MAG: hypothetical protein E6767_05150 [Dysgonomonas sp.]|nr:hypothetical protein [Dysgonomonas sp.]
MKSVIIYIISITVSCSCFSQTFPDICRDSLSNSDIQYILANTIRDKRQVNVPDLIIEDCKEKSILSEDEIDNVIPVRKVELLFDSINGKFRYITDENNIYIFRDRIHISKPYRFRFYYRMEKQEGTEKQFTLHQLNRIDNPILSLFITQIQQKNLECAYAIQIFPDINKWNTHTISLYNIDAFYYKEKGKQGYFVDEGMIAFSSLEELLMHKFGSVDNYIQVYNIKKRWFERESKRLEQYRDDRDHLFYLTTRFSILP